MKTLLLIGSSSAIAQKFAENIDGQEYKLITISRKSATEARNTHFVLDVTRDELPQIEEPINGLVYFPGTINLKPFRSIKPEDFLSDYSINVLGAIRCIQHFLPALKKSEHASVVLFSTVAVQLGMPFHSTVASAKGAVEGLTRSLAAEFAPHIRFNCIAPSLTDTPMAERLINTDDKRELAANRHPLKSIGDPENLASMVKFLLSEDSKWITGQIMHVDGGMSTLRI